jgi:hypothetical protein
VRTFPRATAGAAAVSTLGLTLAVGLAAGASAGGAMVRIDFTASQILVGPPYDDHVAAQVAPDRTTTVNVEVTDIGDPAATAGQVEISIDLSAVASSVDVFGLSADCLPPAADSVICTETLADVAPPVPVPTQAIQLRARPSAAVGPVGAIQLSWSLNNNPAPTTAVINVEVIAAQTPTPQPTTAPPTTTTTTHRASTPAVIKPVPTKTLASPSPSASPTPEVTMTPDPTPAYVAGADPLAGGPPAPIAFATPPGEGGAWRSPALILSLGTAAAGLLIALVYAVISLRRAGRDPS